MAGMVFLGNRALGRHGVQNHENHEFRTENHSCLTTVMVDMCFSGNPPPERHLFFMPRLYMSMCHHNFHLLSMPQLYMSMSHPNFHLFFMTRLNMSMCHHNLANPSESQLILANPS